MSRLAGGSRWVRSAQPRPSTNGGWPARDRDHQGSSCPVRAIGQATGPSTQRGRFDSVTGYHHTGTCAARPRRGRGHRSAARQHARPASGRPHRGGPGRGSRGACAVVDLLQAASRGADPHQAPRFADVLLGPPTQAPPTWTGGRASGTRWAHRGQGLGPPPGGRRWRPDPGGPGSPAPGGPGSGPRGGAGAAHGGGRRGSRPRAARRPRRWGSRGSRRRGSHAPSNEADPSGGWPCSCRQPGMAHRRAASGSSRDGASCRYALPRSRVA